MLSANESEVVDCGHELTLLLSLFHFGRRECPCRRRRPTVPKLLSIIGKDSSVYIRQFYLYINWTYSWAYFQEFIYYVLFCSPMPLVYRDNAFLINDKKVGRFSTLIFRHMRTSMEGQFLYLGCIFLEFLFYITVNMIMIISCDKGWD